MWVLYIAVLAVVGGLSLYVEAVAEDWLKRAEQRPDWARCVPYFTHASSLYFYPYKYARLWWAMCRHPEWQGQYDLPDEEYRHWLWLGGIYYSLTTLALALLLWQGFAA